MPLDGDGDGDKRRIFISATVANYFGLSSYTSLAPLSSSPELGNFLDDGNEFLLCVQHSQDQILVSNKVEAGNSEDKMLVFFKLRPDIITEDNLHSNILVSSMLDSPVNMLYQALRQVFAPVLLKDEKWSKDFDPKLQNLLRELEAGLGSVLRRTDTSYTGNKYKEDDVQAILSPNDEFQFWTERAHRGSKSSSKERALHFKDLFEAITYDYCNLDSLSLFEVVDLVETTRDTVDDVWRQTDHEPFPQQRMQNLLDVIAGSLGRFVQKKLGTFNLWEDSFHIVKENLKAGITICEQWIAACEHLTGQLWQRYTPHLWQAEKYIPEALDKLGKRLEEVLSIRTLHEKLTYFLPTGEQQALHLAQVFEPFAGLNPVHYNPYTEPLWKAAVRQYERIIAPAEQKIASKMKTFISEIQDSPQQLLQAFQKYKELVRRPSISKELLLERETLLAKLQDSIKDYQTDFETRCHGTPGDASGPLSGKNLSEVVNNIVWVRQLQLKVDDAIKIAEALLSDLSGFQNFRQTADELLEQFKVYEQEQFDDWSRDIQSSLSNPKSGICIQASSPVMELDHSDGALKIHYSDRLVTLLREVRQLSALGFVIPAKIQQATNTAQKFCKQAVILKQVAHFYNSIDQQMIPSQKPMMLQSALAFEQIIKHSKAEGQITWDNPKELEVYIKKLQNAAERLATENRKLRKWHTNFTEKVVGLMNIDLLRQQQRWKDGLQELRGVFSTLETQGFLSHDMKAWRQHWNYQLYKALEHQYQMGLEALNENLPEINIDLTYKQGRLQFKPPFEEVRARYYREMKRFISIPNQFKGVSETDEESIFCIMTERNASGFLTTFSKAEDLFRRLAQVADQFKEWVIIGQVDMEALVENHLFNEQDWEKNFKALKVRGKEVERLPSTVKVDCILVNCNPVKSVIDDLIQKLYDILVMSLRKSIQAHLHDINSFLNDAMKTLVTRPQTVDEITEDNLKYKNLKEKKGEVFSFFQEAEGKNKLLRTVAGGGIETISNLRATWDKFELMMESHQLMVKEQIEVMKGNVMSRVKTYLQELEKFKARWDQLKPSDDVIESGHHDLLQKSAETIKEKKIEFDELEDTKQKLINDCCHFELEEPDFSLASEIRRDIDSCSEVWALYEEFQEGFQEKANEDWITFRSKTYLFEEFLLNWHDKLRKIEEHTIMTVKLQKEVDKYKLDNRIISLNLRAGIRNALITILDQLQRCQKSLNEFLEIKKVLELYEQLRQRMGVVIVGPSGAGKSTLWRMLRAALGKIGKVVKQYTMNPKAMPRRQLLGHIDMDTREWSDGVLTNSARQVVRELPGMYSFSIPIYVLAEVFTWARESPPNPNKPLDTYFDSDTQHLMSYLLKKPENLTADDFGNTQTLPVIQTPDMQRGLDYFKPWLGFDSKQPFLLVGPEGCGKGMLLRYAFSQLRSTQIATVHCSAQTTSRHLLQKLSQTCLVISTNVGRVYRPKDCERLVLYLKDINLPKPDKWGTSTLVAFLQQVLTYQGFYDENLEWVGLENIQIVASMSAGGTLGKHKLTSRFTSIVRLCAIDYPERDQLQTIYSAYLEPVLHKNLKDHPAWGSLAKIHQLAGSMVQVYEQARRLFRDKIVGTKELYGFDNVLMKVFQGDWGSDILDNMADSFYVTWGARHELGTVMAPGQTLPPHGRPLGKLNSADLKDVIRKGIIHYGRDNREIEMLLFPEVLDYVSRIDRVLSFPGGSLLLAGHSGVGRRTVTSLVSHMHGAVLITPKISRGYEMKQFKNDLKHVMQLTGIEAQHVVLLLEDYQFVQPTFLEMVNSLLSSGEVPGLYTTEELEPLLSPLKDQASQDGFTGPVFNYFTYRIQQNLHVVLIMDSTNMNFTINCESNPALHKKCQVLWMESWSESSMKKVSIFSLCSNCIFLICDLGDSEFLKSFLIIHESCKPHGATPRRYMTFLHMYRAIHNSKRTELIKRQSHLQNAKRASVAAAPLAAWVKANVQYSYVLERIQPLETEQAGLEDNLRKTEERKQKLEDLVNSVGQKVSEIADELRTLPRRAQLSAAFITYLSAAPEDQRKASLDSWTKSAGLEKFDLRRFLCTESEQLIWKSEGLPSDDLSIENALVILQSKVCPFLIDPSSRATEWLKTHLKESRLEIINQQTLATSQGNILENKDLIESLNQTKASSALIQESLAEFHRLQISLDQVTCFLLCFVSDIFIYFDSQKSIRDQIPSWIEQERTWAVATLKISLPALYQTLCFQDAPLWQAFSRSSMCEQDFPSIIANRISLFQQVLVVQAVRPDRLQSAMALFACKALGIKELSPPPLNLKRLYKETLEIEPILIIISPGADPSQELQELASVERSGDCYHQVAMGQGQADLAIQTVKECARTGEWLCLKNLHLVVSWLPILEKELNNLQPKPGFRLWLTAEVHPKFSPILLQSSLKITYEDYRHVIESLPEDDKPDFFGLPANIARSSQRMISSLVISQLRILSRSVTAGCKFDREIWSNELSPVLNLWKKLNQEKAILYVPWTQTM
uniref:Dynein cytoplasmic 2 heavy chain 1 n=1 Tax=Anolis carolinensis TaxID=28377 RepID=A0A803SUA0_ANOCA